MAEMQVDSMPRPIKRAISGRVVEGGTVAARRTDWPFAMRLAGSKGITLPFAETGKDEDDLPGDRGRGGAGAGEGEGEEPARGGKSCCDGETEASKDEVHTAIL